MNGIPAGVKAYSGSDGSILYYTILGLNFTWLCREELPQGHNNSEKAGCHYGISDKEAVGNKLRVNSSIMAENASYFIKVLVTKHERQAEYTQEVYIVPGDPPEVQIRCLNSTFEFNSICAHNLKLSTHQ